MSKPVETTVTAVVLCGGQGRRMGGADKGLVLLGERPLVAHVLARMAPQVDEVLVSANRNLDAYAAFGARVIADGRDDYPGPLGGLARGLATATHPLVATVPCDAPHLPADLVPRLRTALVESDADVAVAVAGDRVQPVFALYRTRVGPLLDAFLNAGGRKVADWQATLACVRVPFEPGTAFSNVNTPEDLARAGQG